MKLEALDELAQGRAAAWESAGITWNVLHGPMTDKPASWLVLRAADREGQLTLWVSGEVELEWGNAHAGASAEHRDVDTAEELAACVDVLTTAVRALDP